LLREMKPGPTTTSRKAGKSKRGMAPYLLTKTEKIPHTTICGKGYDDSLFWDKRGVILEHYMPRGNPVTSTMYADLLKNHLCPAIKSKQRRRLSTGVLLQRDNARSHNASSTVATIQDCPLSVFHIRRTCQTSPPVTFMSLDHSKRRWDASLSGPTKRSSRRCTSGCTLSQKNFFLEVCMDFRIAITLVWNTVETK